MDRIPDDNRDLIYVVVVKYKIDSRLLCPQ